MAQKEMRLITVRQTGVTLTLITCKCTHKLHCQQLYTRQLLDAEYNPPAKKR